MGTRRVLAGRTRCIEWIDGHRFKWDERAQLCRDCPRDVKPISIDGKPVTDRGAFIRTLRRNGFI